MYGPTREELVEKWKKWEIEREQLQADILKYGMHLESCPCYIPDGKWRDNTHHTKRDEELNIEEINGMTKITVKCTCGYAKVIGQKP